MVAIEEEEVVEEGVVEAVIVADTKTTEAEVVANNNHIRVMASKAKAIEVVIETIDKTKELVVTIKVKIMLVVKMMEGSDKKTGRIQTVILTQMI